MFQTKNLISATKTIDNLNEVMYIKKQKNRCGYRFFPIFCLLSIMFLSCAGPSKVTRSRDFTLSKDTRVAVQPQSAISNIFIKGIEVTLFEMGFKNVVPVEVMLDKNYTDIFLSNQNNSTSGSITTYSAKYVPAAILISFKARQGFFRTRWSFSIIDLRDERLLAYFDNFKSFTNFAKDLSVFVED